MFYLECVSSDNRKTRIRSMTCISAQVYAVILYFILLTVLRAGPIVLSDDDFVIDMVSITLTWRPLRARCVYFTAHVHQHSESNKKVIPLGDRDSESKEKSGISPLTGSPLVVAHRAAKLIPRVCNTKLAEEIKKSSIPFSIFACHPCAGAMLIFSVSFQF